MAVVSVNPGPIRPRETSTLENIAMGVDVAAKILGTGLDAYKTFGIERPKLKMQQEELAANKEAKKEENLKDLLVGGAKEVEPGTPGAVMIGGKSYVKPSANDGLDSDVFKQWSGKGFNIVKDKKGPLGKNEIMLNLPSGSTIRMEKVRASDEDFTGKDRFEIEQQLAKQYADKAQPFSTIQDSVNIVNQTYKNVDLRTINDPAKDLVLVKTFEKLMDPTSAVKEGEVNLIQQQAPLMGQLKLYIDKATGGITGTIPPELRARLLDQINLIYNARLDGMKEFENYMTTRAQRWNVDPQYVMPKRFFEKPSYSNSSIEDKKKSFLGQ